MGAWGGACGWFGLVARGEGRRGVRLCVRACVAVVRWRAEMSARAVASAAHYHAHISGPVTSAEPRGRCLTNDQTTKRQSPEPPRLAKSHETASQEAQEASEEAASQEACEASWEATSPS